MKEDFIARFRCPECSGGIHELDTVLVCDKCCRRFPVRGGIPRFVPTENYCASFGMQWNLHPRVQLDSVNGLGLSRGRLLAGTGWPERMEGQTVLEAGSGAGRFTEVLSTTGATVFSFDYSAAVEANAANNGNSPDCVLFQADVYRIPLTTGSFDKILCFGMLQNTPDPKKAFLSLVPFLKPGGEICMDIYRKDLLALLQWKYLLRPVTTRMDRQRLYGAVQAMVRILGPACSFAGKFLGTAGRRLFPVLDCSHLGFAGALNYEMSVLDTFDMYAPAHDRPQTISEVAGWFAEARLTEVEVKRGLNGIVGKGRRRLREASGS